jgi:ankyrin repeat protein
MPGDIMIPTVHPIRLRRITCPPTLALLQIVLMATIMFCFAFPVCAATRQQHLQDRLHDAIELHDAAKLKALLRQGAVLNPPGHYSALMTLCWAQRTPFNAKFADFLVSLGTDVNAQYYGITALTMVCSAYRGDNLVPTVKWFLAHGAKVNGHGENSPVVALANWDDGLDCFQCSLEAVELLVAHGALVNVADDDGNTPLHGACEPIIYDNREHFQVRLALFLINHGADVNAVNKIHGATPLMCLTEVFDSKLRLAALRIARELLKHGARINIEDQTGQTALDSARHNHFDAMVALLKAHHGHAGSHRGPLARTLGPSVRLVSCTANQRPK